MAVALAALASIAAGCGSETVSGVPAGAVTITPADPTVRLGETIRLTASVRGGAGAEDGARSVFWSSSDEAIATVDASGLVTPHAIGAARIAASAGGQSGVVELRVLDMAVAAVRLVASSTSPAVGDTIDVTVTVLGRGEVQLTGRDVSVRSLSPAILELVGGRGVARGEGPVSLVAESEGVADTIALTVRPAPVRRIDVTPSVLTLDVGGTAPLRVDAFDRDGKPLTGRVATYRSSAASVATVTAEGVVKGVRAGTTTITATVEGVSGTVTVTVRAPVGHEPEPTPTPDPDPDPDPTPDPGTPTAARIEIVSGAIQVGPTNRFLPTNPTVRVVSADGRPVRGVEVQWRANNGGKADNDETLTGADGRTSTKWKLGKSPGAQELTATVKDVGSVTFRALGIPGGGGDDEDDG